MDLAKYPDDEELLRAAASCFGYELGSMVLGRTLLKVPADDVYRNLYLEGFLLHVRNLVEFFCPRKSARRTDIQARHFVPEWEGTEGVRRFDGHSATALLERIDRTLSHMTIFRVGGNGIWNVAGIHDDLISALLAFWEMAPRHRRALFEAHLLSRYGYEPDGSRSSIHPASTP